LRHLFHCGECSITFSLSFSFRRRLFRVSDKLKLVGHFAQTVKIGSNRAKAMRAEKIDLFAPHRAIEWIAVQQNDG